MQKIELQTIQNGAIVDLFNEELKKVLANIEDINTSAGSARTITIKIAIKPDDTRRSAKIQLSVDSSLAKSSPSIGLLYLDKDEKGKLAAYEDEPGNLFDPKVTPINKTQGGL